MKLRKGKWKYQTPAIGMLLRVIAHVPVKGRREFVPMELVVVPYDRFEELTKLGHPHHVPRYATKPSERLIMIHPAPHANKGRLEIVFFPPAVNA